MNRLDQQITVDFGDFGKISPNIVHLVAAAFRSKGWDVKCGSDWGDMYISIGLSDGYFRFR